MMTEKQNMSCVSIMQARKGHLSKTIKEKLSMQYILNHGKMESSNASTHNNELFVT